MVEAATSFRKNSFNDNDSATLAKVATTFQNVSDEAISASESADFIIAQMKAFNIEAGDAEHIIDAVNAVSNSYAVSSGKLAKNLGNMSAALAVGNNSFEESLGLLTAGVEVTRNASKVSRALVSIQSRLNQVIDESSSTGQALTEWYKEHNIAILDQQGQLRSLYDVLTDVAKIWPTLTKNEQAYYLNQQAGANQSQNLAAILSNFDTAAKATATALNSAGSAMRENEAYQSSLAYQTQELKAEFQDLANNVIDKQLITSVLGLGEAFLKLANTGVGQLVTKIGLLGGSAWGLSSLVHVSKILPTIITQFKNFGAVLSLVAEGSSTFGAAISAAGGLASVALPTFLAVSAAVVGIVEAIKYISTADTRKLESLSSSLQETQDKISEMTATGSEYDTLIQNAGKLTDVERTRLGVLQAQLDTLKAQAEEQENAYLTEWQRQQTKTRTDVNVEQRTRDDGSVYYATTGTTEYTEAGRESDNLFEAVYQLNREKQLARTTDAEYLAGLQNILDAHKETYDNLVKLREEYAKTGDETIKLSSEQESFLQIYEHQSEVVGQLGNQYADISNDIGAFGNAAEESASKLDTYIAALEQYRGANENAADASGILVDSLFDANGQLTEAGKQALTTSSSMASMAQSFIQAQQDQAQVDFSKLILAIQEVGTAAAITSAQIANMMAMAGVGGSTADMKRTYEQTYHKSADADPGAYKSWLTSTLQKSGEANYKRKMEAYQKQLSQISSYVPSGGGGGGGGGSSSTKRDQEEVKAQTINTIEELRDYLTDEETRLKLIDPDISKSDLQSTLSEVANIYQSYQEYLSQLKQQGFDETSEQYKQAEAEFAQFMAVLEELFMQIAQKGNYTIEELFQKFQDAIGGIGKSVDELNSSFRDTNSEVKQVTDSLISLIKQGKELQTINVFATDGSGHRVDLNTAFRSGAVSAEDIVWGYETAWDAIREYSNSIEEAYEAAVAQAVKNAAVESDVADEVAEEYDRQNQLLEDKIALEEKLEALEKAKQRRMLVYSEGRFQYMQDADAISSAQKDYQETYRGIEQSQTKDLMSMLGDESKAFFEKYFSNGGDVPNYPNALRKHLLQYVKGQISGTVYEGMSEEGLYNTFGEAMKPGDAYKQILIAYNEAQEAREERRQREAELKKQIREENVKYYGVDTDFGEKIKNAQSQNEVAYWTELRDTKQQMIKEYREAYGDEAASKYFGTDVSKQDTWASNRDLYKEAYESGSDAWRTSKSEFYTGDPNYKYGGYTEKNPDLTVAQYNAATAVDMEGFGDQRLYDRIFSESITKDEIQDLYDKSQSDISKGYLLNLASEMHKAGISGYARGTRHANRGLSLVGENGPELRVLNHGDGILPSGITDNLWRWGSMTPRDMLASLAQKAQSWAQTLNINNVTLPNVRDAQSFVSGLRELAQQYVTRRS